MNTKQAESRVNTAIVAYIAHPIAGDVLQNLENIKNIVREINLTQPDVVPFAPYWLDCHALNDDILEERKRGIKNGIELLKRGFVDEMWLYGNCISNGMSHEIIIATLNGIKVVPKTPETERIYNHYFSNIKTADDL